VPKKRAKKPLQGGTITSTTVANLPPLVPMMSVEDVAVLLRLSPRSVCRLAIEGSIPAVRISSERKQRSLLRFRRDEIERIVMGGAPPAQQQAQAPVSQTSPAPVATAQPQTSSNSKNTK
jgi:excisionase family DNA binding protein